MVNHKWDRLCLDKLQAYLHEEVTVHDVTMIADKTNKLASIKHVTSLGHF